MFSGIQNGFARLHTNVQNTASDFGDHLRKVRRNVGEKVGNGCRKVLGNLLIAASVFEAGKFAAHALPNINLLGNPLTMIAGMALVNPVLNFFNGGKRAVRNSPIKNLYNRVAQTERKALDPEYQGGTAQPYGRHFKKALELATSAQAFDPENYATKGADIITDPISQRRLQGRLAAGMHKDSNGNYASVVRLEDKQGKINNHILAVYQSELKNAHARHPENIDLKKALIIIKNPEPKAGEAELILPQITGNNYEPEMFSDPNKQAFQEKTAAFRKNPFAEENNNINNIVITYRKQRKDDKNWKNKYDQKKQKTEQARNCLQQDLANVKAFINSKPKAGEEGAAMTQFAKTCTESLETVNAIGNITTEKTLEEAQKLMRRIKQKLDPASAEQRIKHGEVVIAGLDAWSGTPQGTLLTAHAETEPPLPLSTSARTAQEKKKKEVLPKRKSNDFIKLLSSWAGKPTANE